MKVREFLSRHMRWGIKQRLVWLVVGSLVMGGVTAGTVLLSAASPAWAAKKGRSARGSVTLDPMVIEAIETLSANDPMIALRVYSIAAQGYQAQNQRDKALAIYEAAAKAFPKEGEVLNRLVELYQQFGRHDEALAAARRLAKLNPEHLFYQQLLANVYFVKGDVKAGLEAWEKLVKKHPDDTDLHLQFAQVLQVRGQQKKAIAVLEGLRARATEEQQKTNYTLRIEQLQGQL